MFKKVLIANRGEIALRVIRACHDLGALAVAVYSEADSQSLHVKAADEAVCIGPGPAAQSYLNQKAILAAARARNAEAIHPGYGFLSEDADFADACRENGFVFIGPPSDVIRSLGAKAAARDLARSLSIPVVPGSQGLIQSDQEAVRVAGEIGYPVLIKASGGGGGRGMRLAANEAELRESLQLTRLEAGAAFGDDGLFLEKYLTHPRHIEFQILGDGAGRVVHLGERECSIQRRYQKLLEESPSAAIDPDLRTRMGADAVRLATAAGYVGAGTVEFLLDGDGSYYFMEVNSRLQVEHGVTEAVTDVDLVVAQLRVAAGEDPGLRQEEIAARGWAIQCRINAEDPAHGFAPRPGLIRELRLPGGPGIRVDTVAYQGWAIPPYYDSLVMKLIAWGPDRASAISRMARALAETRIEGVATTQHLHLSIMMDEEFRSGRFDTSFLGRRLGLRTQI